MYSVYICLWNMAHSAGVQCQYLTDCFSLLLHSPFYAQLSLYWCVQCTEHTLIQASIFLHSRTSCWWHFLWCQYRHRLPIKHSQLECTSCGKRISHIFTSSHFSNFTFVPKLISGYYLHFSGYAETCNVDGNLKQGESEKKLCMQLS